MAFSRNLLQCICATMLMLGIVSSSPSMARTLSHSHMRQTHEEWIAHHGRKYKDAAEKEMRFNVFKANVEHIESSNSAAGRTYTLGVNQFADLTNEEFRTSRYGYKRFPRPHAPVGTTPVKSENVSDVVPESIDWREKGAVTPVKNQGSSGCCWAFSVVAAVEGSNQIKTGKLVSLSEQQMVDCDGADQGCNGGVVDRAYYFVVQNNGLATDTSYPYHGAGGTCNNTNVETSSRAATITGHGYVSANSEASLKNAVAHQPISAPIDPSGFQFYKNGVFNGPCGTNLAHAVAVVGYGTSEDGAKFWLVKNSWGSGWGEQGFMRIQRDVEAAEGVCGIAMQATYPYI